MSKVVATPSRTKEILKKNNINLNKRLGQNFLIDPNIIEIIVDTAEIAGDEIIIEIGPGIGSLTESVLNELNSGKLIAVEKDNRFISILENLFKTDKLLLINEDVLNIDWKLLLDKRAVEGKKVKVIANLPYYITTPVIMGLLESDFNFSTFVFMVQKEVGERMAAGPGTKKYGSLSVAVQFYTEVEIVHHVPPTVFIPRPEVDSSIIKLERYKKIPYNVNNRDFFFAIVKAIFQQRRKNIKNALSKAAEIDLSKNLVLNSLNECGIDPRSRGEKLEIDKMVELSNSLLSEFNK